MDEEKSNNSTDEDDNPIESGEETRLIENYISQKPTS